MKPSVTVVFTGGGTIGHVSPLLAVADELRRLATNRGWQLNLQYIGRRQGHEQPIVERAGIVYTGISTGKLRRYVDFQNFVDPFRVMVGFFQALGLLIRLQPAVVFAKGGYVSLPVMMAARLLVIPIVAHETDSVIGLTNRFAARVANTLCVGFPIDRYIHQAIRAQLVHTGNPVRSEFFRIHRAVRTKPPYTLVVFGGSQGSQSINRVLEGLIAQPLADCSIIHLTGRDHFAQFADRASTWYHPIDYTDHLADLIEQADLVVARAGGSIFELAAAGRPAILIPLSSSANRHQQSNAQYFVDHQAAVVLDETELSPKRLRSEVIRLLTAPAERRQLSQRIQALAVSDAAERVANVLLTTIETTTLHR